MILVFIVHEPCVLTRQLGLTHSIWIHPACSKGTQCNHHVTLMLDKDLNAYATDKE